MRVKMSKQPQPAPTASAVGPCPTLIQIVGRPGTGTLPSTIAPPDHPRKGVGTTQNISTAHFHPGPSLAALVVLTKSILFHYFIYCPSNPASLFFCLPLLLYPSTVPCRIVFAKLDDFYMRPNHLRFRFLTTFSS